MSGILVQQDIQFSSMAPGINARRIPVMVKSRAYVRPKQPVPIQRKKTNFIREWRERPTAEFPKGMGQETLAERSGLSKASISAYELGGNDPSIDALQKLSDALGVPRGMILDVDPTAAPELWDAYHRADEAQRETLGRVAAGLVPPKKGRK